MRKKLLRDVKGEGYIDTAALVLCVFLVLALTVKLLPVFIAKQRLDTYATELCREAEVRGRVGSETGRRQAELSERTGLEPAVWWSKNGRVQLNEEVTVRLSYRYELGLFGGFGSFPVTLEAEASGRSEVYWK